MAALNLQFPFPVSFHRKGGINYNTTVINTSGGQEYRNANWSAPRTKYELSLITPATQGGQPTDLIKYVQDLDAFMRSAQGKLNSFLFFDPLLQQTIRVRFDTDGLDVQVEPSQVADGKPVVSWNNLTLIEVRPPNY